MFQAEQTNIYCRQIFQFSLIFSFPKEEEELKTCPMPFYSFSSPKKFDISNYDRAKGNANLFQEMILPVNSAWALLPHLIAFGLSDEHNK